MKLTLEEVKMIKLLIQQAKGLEKTINGILESDTAEHARYSSFKDMASIYNDIAIQAKKVMQVGMYYMFNLDEMNGWVDSLWPNMKRIMETVLASTRVLISSLEGTIDFVDVEVDNIENFISTKLRSNIFSEPASELQVQNALEGLFVGRNLSKGIDYDREAGKFKFSDREYVPDFVLPKLSTCIEVKLLKDKKRKSSIIEQINADITAYKKEYTNVFFVLYDLGVIRDVVEFKRDIESYDGVKLLIIKH